MERFKSINIQILPGGGKENDMISFIAEMFSYPFIVRAFVVGVLVSLCAALLGVSLVLKQYSMIGDGYLMFPMVLCRLHCHVILHR